MAKRNAVFAALLGSAIAALVPFASAVVTAKGQVVIVGSSASWGELAAAAYNIGACPSVPVHHGACQHYTANTNFNLVDTRPTSLGGTSNTDTGGLWIVWDTPTSGVRNVWAFIKVDSIVGARCFFANPRCSVQTPAGYVWATLGNKLNGLWGDGSSDIAPPADVIALFGTGVKVNTAATDIRPEDALYETCRVNSAQGNGTSGGNDGLDGLGYGVNASGICPQFGADLAHLVGTNIKSGVGASAATANPLAFNISGHDPFTNLTVVAGTVLNIGVQPVVFVFSRSSTVNNGLKAASDATDAQLASVFSGTNCNANALGLASAPIDVYLREPLSGTMTTTEMSVFRRPIDTIHHVTLGTSQEKGVGATNPLKHTACAGGGGTRTRGIGTGQVISGDGTSDGVQFSGGAHNDGIAYTFFSFPNTDKISNSANYGYLTLDGVDPIGPCLPGKCDNQQLPKCTAAPCPQSDFWGGDSFPGLRSGNYTAWQLLRLVTASPANTKSLLNAAYRAAVSTEPDFIPTTATTVGAISDPGVTIWHSHYQERDGAHAALGIAGSNGPLAGFSTGNPPQTAADHGGEVGGCTIQISAITGPAFKGKFIQTNVTESGGTSVATCALARN